MAIHFSADGIHWGEPVAKTGRVVDRSTVFWNPFRQVWVYSIRHVYKVGDDVDKPYGFARRRSYVEGPDLLAAARWEVNEPLRWTDVDRLDPQRDDLKIKPQLYNLDAVAYESLMVGFFTVWRGQPADRHKPNNVVLGYSRDGWHWSRPDRRAFCPVSDKQGDWNANNVQSAGGGFLGARGHTRLDFDVDLTPPLLDVPGPLHTSAAIQIPCSVTNAHENGDQPRGLVTAFAGRNHLGPAIPIASSKARRTSGGWPKQ